jgi:hypothetical protein
VQLLDRASFRRWVESKGMCWSHCPVAPSFGRSERAFGWPWPKPAGHTRSALLSDLILAAIQAASLKETGGFYLWPPYGRWTPGGDQPWYRVRNAILEGLGIPTGFEGAAYFSDGEVNQVAATVFARCFMIDDCIGDSSDDVFVYPGHGRLYLHSDDEELIWGQAAETEALQAFNQELERLGWSWLRDREKNPWRWWDWV